MSTVLDAMRRLLLGVLWTIAGIGLATSACATTRTWDGGGSSNSGGSWQTNANWSNDTKPASGDVAALTDVTSGTRIVTNEATETITQLQITQSSSGGTNRLQFNAGLTITGSGNDPYIVTLNAPAGTSNLVVDLNGQTVSTTLNGWKRHYLRGIWNMTTSGSGIASSSGSDSFRVYGILNLGAGATIVGAPNGDTVNLRYFENYGSVQAAGAGVSQVGVTSSGSSTVAIYHNGSETVTGAVLTVGTGSDSAEFRLRYGNAYLYNYTNNTVTVNAGAILSLYTDTAAQWDWHGTKMINFGAFNLAGKVVFRPNGWNLDVPPAAINDVDNYGTFVVSGVWASLERQIASGALATYFLFGNNAGATLTGAGKLTYTNTTIQTTLNTNLVTNYGTIAPGNPTGTLELVNAAVTFTNGSKLAIQIGGTAPGTYSALVVSRTSTTGGGNGGGGTLNLTSPGETLQVTTLPTFRKDVSNTWTVASAVALSGTFDTPILPDTLHWRVWYTATSVMLTYRPPPLGSMFMVR